MCGITAILVTEGGVAPPRSAVHRMTLEIAHRGPDGSGVDFLDVADRRIARLGPDVADASRYRVALGHRRLSILDLSSQGRQPMYFADRYALTYNGEVYNYVELRAELEALGYAFRSETDTEVILAAYDAWGTSCFARFRGMWGLVLVDAPARRMVLSRDRLGIKPLYVARTHDAIAVVSEIKQLAHLPRFSMVPRADALVDYLELGYENTDRTFYEGVEVVRGGTFVEIGFDGRASDAVSFWSPERIVPTITDPVEASIVFRDAFHESIRIHLRSDVPVGCALSGGLDSSSVAGVSMRLSDGSSGPMHGFNASFPGSPLDERPYVEEVSRHTGVLAHFVEPSAARFLEEIDRFTWIHDEPVGSLSQYAGYCVARLARENAVPVTLNGQGGDEVLLGYWQSYLAHLGTLLRQRRPIELASHVIGAALPGGNDELLRMAPSLARRYLRKRRGRGGDGRAADEAGTDARVDHILRMSPQERRVYEIRELHLPRLLKWDDRNFMAFAVEGRYPFLDHVLIERCLAFDPKALCERGWTKQPIRRGLARALPKSIATRKTKLGFEPPQRAWMRTTLRPALDAFVDRDSGVFAHVPRDRYRAALTHGLGDEANARESGELLLRGLLADRWLGLLSGRHVVAKESEPLRPGDARAAH